MADLTLLENRTVISMDKPNVFPINDSIGAVV